MAPLRRLADAAGRLPLPAEVRFARMSGSSIAAPRRPRATDVLAFHRAYGAHRLRALPAGTLDRPRLLDGAARLLGPWFPDAVGDPVRQAHGIAFPTTAARDAFDPSSRLRHAALGELAPADGGGRRAALAHLPSGRPC